MRTSINYSENEILCFHIGRSGRFHNPDHLTFSGTKKITETSDFSQLFPPRYKNGNDDLRTLKAEWLDETGNSVELTNEMVKTGVGTINHDHAFDTTYTTYLKDLTENEIDAIMEAKPWDLEYIKEALIRLEMIEAETQSDDEE